MKLHAAVTIICAVFAGSAIAQKSPSEVTDAQIRDYKRAAEKSCIEGGKAQKDPPEKVTAFCKCVTGVFEKSLSKSDWQQAFFYSTQNRAAEEENVFGPHEKKLRECTPRS